MADAQSLIARARERREKLLADEHLDLAIPTWGGDLAARYRVVDREQTARMEGESGVSADIALLAHACEVVLVRDEDGQLVEITDDADLPVRMDGRLAAQLGIGDVEMKAAHVIRALFNDNDLALGVHASKVVAWMLDTSREVDGALVGESPDDQR